MAKQPISKKPLFNLSLVVQETGIKADTLRAWERRYQLPNPSRTDGGHRLFSSYDIETIQWLISRQDEGMRISQAVDYWRELIASGIDPLEEHPRETNLPGTQPAVESSLQPLNTLREQWIEYALNFEEERAEQVLDTAFRHYPWEGVCTNLIYRGLSEVGDRWYTGDISVQQEHFTSELVIRKLQSLIADAPQAYHPQKALISNPSGEFHTIAALALNLLLRYRGWEVAYLGANVPLAHFEEALEKIKPDLVIMTAARLATAAELLKNSQLLQEFEIPLAYSGHVFTTVPDLVDQIPGTYLGTDLGEAVSLVETLLSQPNKQPVKPPPPSPYQELANQLKSNLPYLENAALTRLGEENLDDYPSEVIQDANDYLFMDILAALELGNVQFLESNLNWVGGLLKSRNYQGDFFKDYLESFLIVGRELLDPEADEVLDRLESIIQKM
jgi:methanogenic corrinoid protein MtbC1